MTRSIVLIIFFTLFIASCTNPDIAKDAQKIADIECASQKILERAQQGDLSAIEENLMLGKQLDSLKKEIDKKYVTEDDKVKLAQELVTALANCEALKK